MKKMISALLMLLAFQGLLAQKKSIVFSQTQRERDVFYTLMAYSVVYADWQTKAKGDSSRGYNIGCILVNKDHYPVYWAVNSVNQFKKNKTQHGEVRLMQGYEETSKEATVKGLTIYTTLEPCCMCSGMMTLNQIYRTVYGQSDPEYGKALERLQLDSRTCSSINGYSPYPRAVIPNKSPDKVSLRIDAAFNTFQKKENSITAFLSTEEARSLYEQANQAFLQFKTSYPENKPLLDSAHSFYKNMVTALKK